MRITWIGSALFCSLMAFGCGGGSDSGVDPDLLLADLLPEESDAVCEAALSVPVDEREVDCGDGITIDITQPDAGDIADCADTLDSIGEEFPDCPATVGEFDDCQVALATGNDDELCAAFVDGEFPPACDFLFDPACGGV